MLSRSLQWDPFALLYGADGGRYPWGVGLRQAYPSRVRAGELPVNVSETDDAYIVEAEVPGLSLEDIEVSVRGRELTIQGELPTCSEKGNYLVRERSAGKFGRVVAFPVDIDAQHVEARLKQGVLTIQLPKSAEVRPKKIQVTAY